MDKIIDCTRSLICLFVFSYFLFRVGWRDMFATSVLVAQAFDKQLDTIVSILMIYVF